MLYSGTQLTFDFYNELRLPFIPFTILKARTIPALNWPFSNCVACYLQNGMIVVCDVINRLTFYQNDGSLIYEKDVDMYSMQKAHEVFDPFIKARTKVVEEESSKPLQKSFENAQATKMYKKAMGRV